MLACAPARCNVSIRETSEPELNFKLSQAGCNLDVIIFDKQPVPVSHVACIWGMKLETEPVTLPQI